MEPSRAVHPGWYCLPTRACRNLARVKAIQFLLILLIFSACAPRRNFDGHGPKATSSAEVKVIPIETPKGTFKVWTKTVGQNPRIRVLLLHGGPGATSDYMECFAQFLPREGIEVIFYDQLGSAHSDQPDDRDLWEIPRFVEEVEQVRKDLGLNRDNFYLLGHSWGGILAIEYALKYPSELKALIISNMMSSCPAYDAYSDRLARQMDPDVLAEIRDLEAREDFSNPRYEELLLKQHYPRHFLRLSPWPAAVLEAFPKLNKDIYLLMQGPSEFGISGRLEKWDRSQDIHRIERPTLVIGAEHDTMDPGHMRWMAGQLPKGNYLHCSNGSHMAMYDDQETYMRGLLHFLKAVDSRATPK